MDNEKIEDNICIKEIRDLFKYQRKIKNKR